MKKKKILLGLALAAAAVFSLSACGDDNETPADNGGSEVTPENGGGSGTQTQEYSVTYHTAHGTAPAALSDVNALPTDLPTLTDADYSFGGWATTENGTTPVTGGTAITSNTDLYAIWTAKTLYEKYSISQNKLYSNDFSTTTDNITAWNDYDGIAKGIASISNQTDALNVSIVDGKLSATDSSESDSSEAYVSFGMEFAGTLEGTMKYTPCNSNTDSSKTLNSGWTMVSFRGYTSLKPKPEVLFGLRTNNDKKIAVYFASECGKDSSNKTTYEFRGTPFEYKANTEYQIDWKYDFTTKKLTIKINNTDVLVDYDVPLASQPIFLTGNSFITAGSDTKRSAKIDEYAVINSNMPSLDEAKTYFKGLLDAKANLIKNDPNYSFAATGVDDAVSIDKQAIDAETIKDNVILRFISSITLGFQTNDELKSIIASQLKKAKETLAPNYVYNATAFNNVFDSRINAINNATTADEYIAAMMELDYKNDLSAIDTDSSIRIERILTFRDYYVEKLEYIRSLDISDKEVAATELFNVSCKYETTDSTLKSTLTYCDITDIDELLEVAKKEIDAIVTEYSLTLEDLAKLYNEDINTKKSEAKDKFVDNQFDAEVDEIEVLVVTDTTTKGTLKTAYEQKLARLDYLDEWYGAFVATIDEYRQYAYAEREEKCLDKTVNYQKYCIDVLSEYFKTRYTDLIAIEYSTDNYDELIADFIETTKEKVDEIIAEYREQTEWTVIFKKKETDTDENAYATVQVIKGGTIAAPETDPTLAGFKFAGWDFDFDDTIEDDTEIVALWHDLYYKETTETFDYSGFTYNENSKITSTNNIIEFYSNNSSDKVETDGLWINGSTKNTRYLKVTVTTNATITLVVNPKDKDRYVAIASSAGSASSSGYTADTSTLKKASSNTDTTMVFTVTPGTYYLNTSDKLYFKSINVVYGGSPVEITGITASIANDGNLIKVSDVKLVDIDDNEIAITEGYYVSVVNSANEVVENWQGALPAGNYKVYVQYGSFTQILGLVEINGMA
ncbi:MAG: InlB B-repeat-containing protein [Acholeplasmatales bacterium]|nr:InlB B-repeat-containing protein [Acholeplasmatales bacterium]